MSRIFKLAPFLAVVATLTLSARAGLLEYTAAEAAACAEMFQYGVRDHCQARKYILEAAEGAWDDAKDRGIAIDQPDRNNQRRGHQHLTELLDQHVVVKNQAGLKAEFSDYNWALTNSALKVEERKAGFFKTQWCGIYANAIVRVGVEKARTIAEGVLGVNPDTIPSPPPWTLSGLGVGGLGYTQIQPSGGVPIQPGDVCVFPTRYNPKTGKHDPVQHHALIIYVGANDAGAPVIGLHEGNAMGANCAVAGSGSTVCQSTKSSCPTYWSFFYGK